MATCGEESKIKVCSDPLIIPPNSFYRYFMDKSCCALPWVPSICVMDSALGPFIGSLRVNGGTCPSFKDDAFRANEVMLHTFHGYLLFTTPPPTSPSSPPHTHSLCPGTGELVSSRYDQTIAFHQILWPQEDEQVCVIDIYLFWLK